MSKCIWSGLWVVSYLVVQFQTALQLVLLFPGSWVQLSSVSRLVHDCVWFVSWLLMLVVLFWFAGSWIVSATAVSADCWLSGDNRIDIEFTSCPYLYFGVFRLQCKLFLYGHWQGNISVCVLVVVAVWLYSSRQTHDDVVFVFDSFWQMFHLKLPAGWGNNLSTLFHALNWHEVAAQKALIADRRLEYRASLPGWNSHRKMESDPPSFSQADVKRYRTPAINPVEHWLHWEDTRRLEEILESKA